MKEKTIKNNKKVLNWSESTPEERKNFYENIVISKEQARQFAFDIYDTLMHDIMAMRLENRKPG